jgi:hypothetical protein
MAAEYLMPVENFADQAQTDLGDDDRGFDGSHLGDLIKTLYCLFESAKASLDLGV